MLYSTLSADEMGLEDASMDGCWLACKIGNLLEFEKLKSWNSNRVVYYIAEVNILPLDPLHLPLLPSN